MENIKIISVHESLEDAIAEAGGLNREYNAPLFDKEVEAVKKQAVVQEFYVIEQYGRKEVLYQYQCDIKLLNSFSPYGATLSSSTECGWLLGDEIAHRQTIPNNSENRKTIARIQEIDEDFYVLNF